jgi:hypothetical protein
VADQPDTVYDPTLGQLTWSDDDGGWAGQVDLAPGHTIEVIVDKWDGEELDLPAALAAAHTSLGRILADEGGVRRAIAGKLHARFNQTWSQGRPLTEAEFIGRLRLSAAGFQPDGSAVLYYNDGGLFAGHLVLVELRADGGFGDAFLAG